MKYFISSNFKNLLTNWEKYVFHWEKWDFEPFYEFCAYGRTFGLRKSPE